MLFFDRSAPTKDIWYYEQPTPEGRKSYSKTQPVQFEEFSDCIAWWNKRIETKRAWRASGEQVLKYDADGKLLSVNLDVKNPNGNEDIEHLPPARLVENILAKERKILSILEGIRSSLGVLVWQLATLGDVLRLRTPDTPVDPTAAYRFAGVYSFGRGVFRGIERKGNEFSYRALTRLREGQFVYPKLMAWEGAFGVVPANCSGCYGSPEFPVFEVNTLRLLPRFLGLYFQIPVVWESASGGSTVTNVRRRRLHPTDFLRLQMPLPPLSEQQRVVDTVDGIATKIRAARMLRLQTDQETTAIIAAEEMAVWPAESLASPRTLNPSHSFDSGHFARSRTNMKLVGSRRMSSLAA